MAEKFAVTIGRQFGSDGREIGLRVGELLGVKVYDRELIILAAQKHGVDPDYLRRVDEKATNSLLYTLALGSSLYGARHFGVDMSINDQLFQTQADIIREAAEEGSCVFVGRCADYVLRDYPGRISFFIYANEEARIARVMERHNVPRDEAEDMIRKNDKRRVNYYNFYTGRKWGKFDNYHMSVDSTLLGVDGTAKMIADIVKIYQARGEAEQKT